MKRTCATLALAAAAVFTPVGAAQADGGSGTGDGGSGTAEEFVWPPAESTHGRWLPVPAAYYEGSTDIEACGTTVSYGFGDVRALQYKAVIRRDGTELVFYRGRATSDLVRASDGATLDEVRNDGPGVEVYSPDQLTITFTFTGPAVFPAFDAVERAAFRRAGLPTLAVYRAGVLSERIQVSADPDATTDVSAEILLNRTVGLVDGCRLLDRARR